MTTALRPFRRVAYAGVLYACTTLAAFGQANKDIAANPTGSDIATTADTALQSGAIAPVIAPSRSSTRLAPAGVTDVSSNELPYRDNTPLVTVDNRIMFFNSTRGGERPWRRLVNGGERWDDDVYYRVRSNPDDVAAEQWSDAVNLGPAINTSADDGVAAISSNGTRMYFVSMRDGWDQDGGPFYVADLSGTAVATSGGMGGGISRFFRARDRSRNFNVYGAAIDAYERLFYFATTVHSTAGEQEIWVSRFDGDSWGYPVNLGRNVNAPGGSYSPFIAADGLTLYFASGRKGGFGGDDIYRAGLDSLGNVLSVLNLGPTINTDGNEAFFSIPASGDRVYLSSSRNGVESLKGAPLEPSMRPGGVAVLSGKVVDGRTSAPVSASIRIEDLATDSVVFVARTSEIDDRYSTVLRPGRTYGISISAPGYVFTSTSYTIGDTVDFVELIRNFELEPLGVDENFTLHNIFFEYNSADLNRSSANELRRLAGLLAERARLRIEVGGHTDDIGSDDYNNDLSSRRARAVREYLINVCGIEPIRVMSHGFGSKQPIAPNETESGRRENRRVTFRIVSM